jgi:hypothetical protein
MFIFRKRDLRKWSAKGTQINRLDNPDDKLQMTSWEKLEILDY